MPVSFLTEQHRNPYGRFVGELTLEQLTNPPPGERSPMRVKMGHQFSQERMALSDSSPLIAAQIRINPVCGSGSRSCERTH